MVNCESSKKKKKKVNCDSRNVTLYMGPSIILFLCTIHNKPFNLVVKKLYRYII